MPEVTNRNIVREAIAAGGWVIVWGDLINEWDIITLVVSFPTGSAGIWVSQQIDAQASKFGQSLGNVSDDVVNQATAFLKQLLKDRRSEERDFNGLGVKAGIATYNRKYKTRWGSVKLPNNHQPYVGLRVTKPLPPKGALPMIAAAAAPLADEKWDEDENQDAVVQGLTPDAVDAMNHQRARGLLGAAKAKL